jgi:uncharacterized protein (DUF885 family)
MPFSRRAMLGAGLMALMVQDQAWAAKRKRPAGTLSARLRQVFAQSDEAFLKRSPISALFRGDMRYAGTFGDYLSDASVARAKADIQTDLQRLRAIPRDRLEAGDQISYDVFEYTQAQSLKGFDQPYLDIGLLQPVDHFNGFHVFFPQLQSGQSAAPFRTPVDYEAALSRSAGYVKYTDDAIIRMREGMAKGIVQPKLVMANVVNQLGDLIKMRREGSPFFLPIRNLPKTMSQKDKTRFTAAYADMLDKQITPAHARLRDFIVNTYLPKCRDSVGLSGLPRGIDQYQLLIETQTTTSQTPDQIHQLGLEQVAYLRSEMEKTKAKIGFDGDLKAYFQNLRDDPKLKFATKADLLAGYEAIRGKVDPVLGKLFRNKPNTPFEIRPVPEFQERNQAAASYQSGTPDGKRPGVFYVNTYDLPSRTKPGMETLFLHEAVPGHHYQISLAQERSSLPNFQRFGGNVAYVEGWALYAESLGPELGLFTDPYQYHGHLDDAMLRAMRLVVDTGLHAKGWTREQGIQYFLDNSSQSQTDSTAEIERYIAMPAQALGYMIGKLKIRELRARATQAFGPKFDVRDFHDQVLLSGALPLDILERKIDRWIAQSKA